MSRFDRFMVYVDIGRDEKLARLTDAERLCHIAGVLALAAKSPIRGRLLVGELEASPREVGRMAAVSDRVAKSTIDKLVLVGVLLRDDEYDCWRVHNWEVYNPEPKADTTAAERAQRYRDRRRERDGNACVTPAVTPASRRDGRDANGAVTPPRARANAIAPARSPEGVEEEEELLLPRAGEPEYPVTDPLASVNDERVTAAVAILRTCPQKIRLDCELIGVANALNDHPNVNAESAARRAVVIANAMDNSIDSGRVMWMACQDITADLERQQRPRAAAGRTPPAAKPWAGALRPLTDNSEAA